MAKAPLVCAAPPPTSDGVDRRARRFLLGCLTLTMLGLCTVTHALSPERSLSQLRHDRWTPDDGAPAQIMAITQTPDGFLWLGSRQGLYRFDGLRFERITKIAGEAVVDDDILSLMAEKDGSVWIGYISGGMSRTGGQHEKNYEYQRDDVPQGSVIGFARDAAGRRGTPVGSYPRNGGPA